MSRSAMKIGAAALLAAVVVAACGNPTESQSTTASTTPALPFPYPPKQYYTEVAVPLEEPLLSAAKFALEMLVEDERVVDPRDAESVRAKFRSKVDPEGDTHENTNPFLPTGVVDDTGGETLRVVGTQGLPDGVVEVSICIYDSPGVYTLQKGGDVRGPVSSQPPNGLRRTQVRWTNRPAADGSVPSGPRWLWVHNGFGLVVDQSTVAAGCDPFKPNPFIQKMPDPTTLIPTPTR